MATSAPSVLLLVFHIARAQVNPMAAQPSLLQVIIDGINIHLHLYSSRSC